MTTDTDIVVFSDLHLDEWPMYGEMLPKLGHSRLQDGLAILDQISRYMAEEQLTRGIFLGDILHRHGVVLASAAAGLTRWLLSEREQGRRWDFVLGNHDQDMHGLTHALVPFQPYVHVVDALEELEVNGHRIVAVPWQLRPCAIRLPAKQKVYSLIVMHSDPADVHYRGHYIGRAGSYRAFTDTFVLNGHYHDQDVVSPHFRCVGACMQHNWSDEGQSRGFWRVTLRREKAPVYRFVQTQFPRFVTLTTAQVLELTSKKGALRAAVEGHFIRHVRSGKLAHDKAAATFLKESNPRIIEPVRVLPALEQPVTERRAVIHAEDILDGYVDQYAAKEFSKKRLKQIGRQALREVG